MVEQQIVVKYIIHTIYGDVKWQGAKFPRFYFVKIRENKYFFKNVPKNLSKKRVVNEINHAEIDISSIPAHRLTDPQGSKVSSV